MRAAEPGLASAAIRLETGSSSYVLVAPLASGGMAEVSLVMRREGSFSRLYAMKRLHAHLQGDEQVRAMFVDEARYAGLIRHAHVVSVLDVGEDASGPFLVMDYVDGVSLSELLKARGGSPIPLQLCLRIVAQIAEGLHAAHELKDASGNPLHLVHRDVSPQNVLVGYDGVVRVMDFGIAKALGQSSRTATGVVKGKFGYMAPEQLRFEEADKQSDLFAIGVVLYELLSGKRLYANREGMDGVRRILSEPTPDITDHRPETPPGVVQLLFELLAKKRAQRPATAREVARRLESEVVELAATEGAEELTDYLDSQFGDQRRRRSLELQQLLARAEAAPAGVAAQPRAAPGRRAKWALGAAALLVASTIGFVGWRSQAKPTPPAEAPSVAVVVESSPAGAEVVVAGDPRGTTPLTLTLRRGTERLPLELSKSGFEPLRAVVVPDMDQRQRFSLVQQVSPMVVEDAQAPEAPPPVPAPRRGARSGKVAPKPVAKPTRTFERFE